MAELVAFLVSPAKRLSVMRLSPLLPVALVLALVTWEVPTVVPRIGFDNSWQIALNLAAPQGLDYGREIVFNYGPLGFLSQPLILSAGTFGAAFAYAVVAQVTLATVVLASAWRIYGRLGGTLAAFLALGLTLLLSDVLVYLAFFTAVAVLERDDPPRGRWLLPLCGAAAAFALLVKLNVGVICFILFALAAWRLPPRRVAAVLVFATSFALSLVVLWLATGNPPAALPTWLRHSRHLISGYTDAVALDAPERGRTWMLAAVLVVAAAALLVPRLRELPRSRSVPLVIAAAVYTFAYVKEGFVRSDTHALYFFGAFGLSVLAFTWRGPARWAAAALVVGAAVAAVAGPSMSLDRVYRPDVRVRAAASAARDAVDGPRRRRDLARAQAVVRSQLALSAHDLRLLRGHSVDIVPYETSLVSAYGLSWRPEPVLQWYTAFDAHLDRVNASALMGHGADRILRQRTPTLDSKVAEFEAPATYLTLVCHYRELAADGSWEVLARTRNRCGEPQTIATVRGRADEPVGVPRAGRDDIVYARIRFPRSLSKRLESVLFRPLKLPRITLGGGFRFVPATATGPLVMRMPASGGLSPLFGGFVAYDWFQLTHVPSPFWVDFVALPVRGSAAISIPRPPRPGRLAASEIDVSGRRYRIAPGAFDGWVDVARPAGRAAILAGWAIDPKARRPAPLVAAFVDGQLAALAEPSQARPDVAQGLDVPTIATSGYSLAFRVPRGAPHVRVFALGHGVATELKYPSGYLWR